MTVRRASGALLVGLLSLTGCSDDQGRDDVASSRPHPVALIVDSGAHVDYSQGWTDDQMFECLAAEGFEYDAPDRDPADLQVISPDDLDWREQYGFGISIPVETAEQVLSYDLASSDEYERMSPDEQDKFDRAYGECSDTIEQRYNDALGRYVDSLDPSQQEQLGGLISDYLESTVDDEDWIRCMSTEGFATSSRSELLDGFAGRAEVVADGTDDQADLQAEERKAAVADYKCAGIEAAMERQVETIGQLMEQAPDEDILG